MAENKEKKVVAKAAKESKKVETKPKAKAAKPTEEEKAQAKAKAAIVKNITDVLKKIDVEVKPVAANLKKLSDALKSNAALQEDKVHLRLLKVQEQAMGLYVSILEQRKEHLSAVVKELKK